MYTVFHKSFRRRIIHNEYQRKETDFKVFYDLQSCYYDTFLIKDCRTHVRNVYVGIVIKFKKIPLCMLLEGCGVSIEFIMAIFIILC